MKLVNTGDSITFINIDFIASMYISGEEYHVRLIDGTYYKITEKAYNTILKYGKAEV